MTEKRLLNQIHDLDKEVDRRYLAVGTRKKIADNPLVQKNLGFLRTYSNLFGKNLKCGGNPDTNFKNSLRKYGEGFDIVKEFNLGRPKKVRTSSNDHAHSIIKVLRLNKGRVLHNTTVAILPGIALKISRKRRKPTV